jgi:hypothetical protein
VRTLSSKIRCLVGVVRRTNVSKEPVASIFTVTKLGTLVVLTTATRRHTPKDNTVHYYRLEKYPRRQRSLSYMVFLSEEASQDTFDEATAHVQ